MFYPAGHPSGGLSRSEVKSSSVTLPEYSDLLSFSGSRGYFVKNESD